MVFAELRKNHGTENHLTNALAVLINEFLYTDVLQQDRDVALQILNIIGRKNGDPKFRDEEHIDLNCQEDLQDKGKVDLRVNSNWHGMPFREVFIEVKDRSNVQQGQLIRYKSALKKRSARIKKLSQNIERCLNGK